MNDAPLPPQHGFPLRLVVPGWYGMTNVKWLSAITVTTDAFAGYQQTTAYRYRRDEQEVGRAVTRMRPRSLIVPPGMPDFHTRERVVEGSPVSLEGRAWSGRAPIARVEVSDDGGASWVEARLTRDLDGPWAWVRWSSSDWEPGRAGAFSLCCSGDRRDR